MLILVRYGPTTRQAKEDPRRQEFTIETSDGPVRVKVAGGYGGRIEIGVDAPAACRVLRGELLGAA